MTSLKETMHRSVSSDKASYEVADCSDSSSSESDSDKEYNQQASNKSLCNCKYFKEFCNLIPIIHPLHTLRIVWDLIVMVILIYTCLEIPFSLAFGIQLTLEKTAGVLALLIDCLLLIDIILNYRTAYFDKYDDEILITNSKRIAFRYFTSWFLLDICTSIPFEFILPDDLSYGNFPTLLKVLRIFRMVRLLKLLRFFRMLKTFNSLIASLMTRSVILFAQLFKLLCLMLLSTHFVACIWFYIGKHSFNKYGAGGSWLYPSSTVAIEDTLLGKDILEQYLTSFYWSVVTLYTTGYGDIVPKSIDEKLVCCFIILVGTCFFAYFIGAVAAMVTEGDRLKAAQMEKIQEAQAFCVNKKLPSNISRTLMNHAKYHFSRNFIFDDMEIVNSLPKYLKNEVCDSLDKKYLHNCELFEDLPITIRGLIALKLQSISANANKTLINANEYGKKMYIQRTGISYLMDKNAAENGLQTLERGAVFGYNSLVKYKYDTTVICGTFCEFYSLDRDELQEILRENYPKHWNTFWKTIKMKLKNLEQNKISAINVQFGSFMAKKKHKIARKLRKYKSWMSTASNSHYSLPTTNRKRNNKAKKVKNILGVSDSEARDDYVVKHKKYFVSKHEKEELQQRLSIVNNKNNNHIEEEKYSLTDLYQEEEQYIPKLLRLNKNYSGGSAGGSRKIGKMGKMRRNGGIKLPTTKFSQVKIDDQGLSVDISPGNTSLKNMEKRSKSENDRLEIEIQQDLQSGHFEATLPTLQFSTLNTFLEVEEDSK